MLIQFLVENFLSFKDETVFSLLAPPEETRGVVEIPAHGLRLMRIAAFYGANASGKSNIVKAMEVARELVVRDQSTDMELPAHYFRLDEGASTRPSRFQFDFLVGDIRYCYILSFTRNTIVAEALYRRLPNTSEDEMLYEREAPEQGEHQVTFGTIFASKSDEDRQFARFTARGAHVRQSLLSKFTAGNVHEFKPIHNWFNVGLKLIGAQTAYQDLIPELYRNDAMRQFFSEMLAKVGTGIRTIEIIPRENNELTKMMRIARLAAEEVARSMTVRPRFIGQRLQKGLITTMETEIGFDGDGTETKVLEIKFVHANSKGIEALFKVSDESDGTKRLLHLLPILFHRTQEAGLCTVIDELDRSLHTTLTRHFIQEFLNMAAASQTQLIFTTHDTNLLNGRLLPIPAIWFVEKDDDGASHIYSLAEYKPDQIEQLLEHLEQGYLQGRFGAIPFIADRHNLRWQVREEKPAQ